MFAELFILGSMWWWLLSIVAVVVILAAMECENGVGASVSFLLYLGLITLFGDGSGAFQWLWQHPIHALGVVAGYFVAGTVWCVVKWFFFVRKMASEQTEQYVEVRKGFLKEAKTSGTLDQSVPITEKTVIPDGLQKSWKERISRYPDMLLAPEASQYKSTITMWLGFWPISAIWTLLNDPIRAAARHIYNSIKDSLQRISERAFKSALVMQEADTTPTEEEVTK